MGASDIWNAFVETRAPKPKWTAADMPDLSGKVVLVTGGNAGIGKETAKALLQHNAKVYIGCRSPEKAAAAVSELLGQTGKTTRDLQVLRMDLANLPTVKAAVTEFLSRETRLDQLYNNAGVMWCDVSMLTAHGHDLQFGTNVLGHFYLTQLLLPTLLASVSTSPDKHVRIVNVTSNAQWDAPAEKKGGPILYDTIVEGLARKKVTTQTLYSQSKAGNVLIANALARKYGSQGIVSTSVFPGLIQSELQRHTSPLVHGILNHTILHPTPMGAITSLYAGTAPEAVDLNGKYLVPWARVRYARKDMDSVEHQEKLWAWCEEEVTRFSP